MEKLTFKINTGKPNFNGEHIILIFDREFKAHFRVKEAGKASSMSIGAFLEHDLKPENQSKH